jgi:hypothetical protein
LQPVLRLLSRQAPQGPGLASVVVEVSGTSPRCLDSSTVRRPISPARRNATRQWTGDRPCRLLIHGTWDRLPASCSDVIIPVLARRLRCKRRGLVIHASRNPSQETERQSQRPRESSGSPEPTDSTDSMCWRFCWWTNASPVNPSKSRDAGPCPLHQDPGLPGRIGIRTPRTDLGWTGQIYGTDNSKPAQADTFNPFAATFRFGAARQQDVTEIGRLSTAERALNGARPSQLR